MRRELVRGCTSGGCDQLETSPETIEQELRPGVFEHRQTNYSIDWPKHYQNLQGNVIVQ